MRFRRRAEDDAPERTGPAGPEDLDDPVVDEPAEPQLPLPHVAFAAVLDGRRLTVALDAASLDPAAAAGRIALRPARGGEVLDDLGEAAGVPAQPGFLDARLDLHRLPDDAPGAAYDVVLVPPGGEPLPLWTPPLPDRVIPVAPYRTTLLRTAEGTLQVRRGRSPQAARLAELRLLPLRPEAARLRLDADEPLDGGRLLLVPVRGDDRPPVGSWPVSDEPAGGVVAVLDHDGLVAGTDGLADVVVETTDARRLPVTRADNSLDARTAVTLPRLELDSGVAWLRLRWHGDGRLQARLLDPDGGEGAP